MEPKLLILGGDKTVISLESMYLRKWMLVYTCIESKDALSLIKILGITHIIIDEQSDIKDLSKWTSQLSILFPNLITIGLVASNKNAFEKVKLNHFLKKPFPSHEILDKIMMLH